MNEGGIGFLIFFGYLSMCLLLAAFFRSQFKILQKYLIPSGIIAGFIMLAIGPSLLNIVRFPVGEEAELLTFHLISVIFVIIGLRGYGPAEKAEAKDTFKLTAVATSTLAVQFLIGLLFTFIVVFLINPNFFAGFGSLLMLGQGLDSTVAHFFGGYWEQDLGFTGGKSIAFSFSALGFLLAYLVGLGYIIWARSRGAAEALPGENTATVQSGIVPKGGRKKAGALLTAHPQSIETFTLHLALIGFCLLLLYGLIRIVILLVANYLPPDILIVAEHFTGFNYLLGLLIGLAVRKLMDLIKVDYIVDNGVLNRLLGIAVDFMVVAAIVSIPLALSRVNPWEILLLSLAGAVLTLFAVKLLLEKVYRDGDLEKQVALYGFLTGNISSALALLRIMDPQLQKPLARSLAYTGGLSFLAAVPLLYLMHVPIFGGEMFHFLRAAVLALAYAVLIFVIWHFAVGRRRSSGKG